MGYVRNFTGYRPGARTDGSAWTIARIEEAPDDDGAPGTWTVIDTQTLDPVEDDPTDPISRDLTTEEAALAEGWYRVVFVDADGDEQITDPVVYPPVEALRPSRDEVALLLRTRTTGGLSTGLGGDTGPGDLTTFTSSTRPTATEVDRVIDVAFDAVSGELTPVIPGDLPAGQYGQVRHAVALYAAIMIETSFFREQADDAALGIWRDLYAAAIGRISGAIGADGRSRRMVSMTQASPYGGRTTSDLDFDFPL